MPTFHRPSGVAVSLPADLAIQKASERPAPGPRRAGPGRSFGPVPMPTSPTIAGAAPAWQAELVSAFGQQEMTLLDQVELVAAPAAPAPPSTRRSKTQQVTSPTLDLDVPLAAREDTAVLLEQDGFYSWHFAAEIPPTPVDAPAARRGQPLAGYARRARLSISLTGGRLGETGTAASRGVISDFLLGRVKAFIFKFAARVVVGQAMKFLERQVQRGLVLMPGPDPASWHLLADPTALPLPADRPACVLLFIHGTFSSTVSAYGALPATPWGQAFLAAAYATYDLVLGFDHATLSEDPLENATELLAALQGVAWPYPPRLDVITHSRGGLVLRCLLEELLPLTSFTPQVERVIFVGVTNGGTLLASPANWQALVDLYTNLAVGTCQLLGMLPQAKALTTVLAEIVRGLGAFVKYLATTAVTDRVVPGLAAMEPTGEFIQRLNQAQPHQPTIAQSYYCAVTSAFQPQLLGGGHEPRELPARLVQWLAGGFMQQLMREANDLVVNTAAMTQIDPVVGNYLKDSLAFGPNPQVYHTNYFVWPRVINALARWLRLTLPAANPVELAAVPARRRSQSRAAPVAAGPATGALGRFVAAELPAAVDLDIIVLPATATVGEALAAVRAAHPSFVVVRRFGPGEPQEYAFTAEDLLALARRAATITLELALHLASTPPSTVYNSVSSLPRPTSPELEPTPATHAVVRQQGWPVGVLPPAGPLLTSTELVALARRVSQPRREVDFISQRRALPTFLGPNATLDLDERGLRSPILAGAAAAGAAGAGFEAAFIPPSLPPRKPKSTQKPTPRPVSCYFRAEMDEVIGVGRPTTVEVLIAREQLVQATGLAAAGVPAAVAADQPLLVQVVPRVNFDLVEVAERYQIEVPVPAPGAPQALYFTLRATHVGEGEVWVRVLQQQVPLLTLRLQPQVVEAPAGPSGRVQVGATATEAPPTPAVQQLTILERRNGLQLTYQFILQLPALGVLKTAESQPFTGDRQQYVENIYHEIEQRWLSSAADSQNFTAELRALGGTLFDQLVPTDLQALLWQHRDQLTSILVLSEEPFIPWELVHLHPPGQGLRGDKQYFLGQLGLVRWLHEAGWPPQQLRLRAGKGRYVIPHYPHPDYALPATVVEEKFLREELGAKRVLPTAQAVRTLLQQPGPLDFLHFAGHGEASLGNIANAQLLLEGRVEGADYLREYLGASTVEQYANFSKSRPLVFLNACQAGRTGYQLTGIGGFARSFLLRGASAFVGALWSVGDQPASTFTQAFYRQLRDGATLAQATTAARETARQAGDATWLAYAVYGHPYATTSAR